MHKRVGIGALNKDPFKQYEQVGNELIEQQAEEIASQLSTFQEALKNFAKEHAAEIRNNAEFRRTFTKLSLKVGLDPLVSGSGESAWSAVGMNEFYLQVAVRVVEVCHATQLENGGLVSGSRVCQFLNEENEASGYDLLTEDDIIRAVEALKPLGPGCDIEEIAGKRYIRSLPLELSKDQNFVLEAVEVLGYVTVSILKDNYGWDHGRCIHVLNDLVSKSLLWIDNQSVETTYWGASTLIDEKPFQIVEY
ncbi:EAP30 family protein Dot2 [Schizosaccharomyces cryophilus OY26]|uniref:EAP30 family protein Dot2 n=1 Tax=Schizosaccharomyces cryophilus (strain OY26 / ATCC MYA-4695 / CBS 11777 / NBRC 106824 / NRRL Y48691) TaxID=653667 RepID=S9VT92_SCHCR|nr:EAP30 family protein Dot2 [Schizosaccharomyces cryophilus OY26]EPY49324.1 EAP30 family protein Dot2 [Schizosaccharomyces cryophilus OY26]